MYSVLSSYGGRSSNVPAHRCTSSHTHREAGILHSLSCVIVDLKSIYVLYAYSRQYTRHTAKRYSLSLFLQIIVKWKFYFSFCYSYLLYSISISRTRLLNEISWRSRSRNKNEIRNGMGGEYRARVSLVTSSHRTRVGGCHVQRNLFSFRTA